MSSHTAVIWKLLFIAPIVMISVCFGLWVSFNAAIESFMILRATSQTVAIVAEARNMAPDAAGDPDRVTQTLIERLIEYNNMRSAEANTPAGKALLDPWGGLINLQIYPAYQQIVLQSYASPVACRRLIEFYGKEAKALGLLRVETRDDQPTAATRLLYESSPSTPLPTLDSSSISGGCGHAANVILALTFRLRL